MLLELEDAAAQLARPRLFLDKDDERAAAELVLIVGEISSWPHSHFSHQIEDLMKIAEVLLSRSKMLN